MSVWVRDAQWLGFGMGAGGRTLPPGVRFLIRAPHPHSEKIL